MDRRWCRVVEPTAIDTHTHTYPSPPAIPIHPPMKRHRRRLEASRSRDIHYRSRPYQAARIGHRKPKKSPSALPKPPVNLIESDPHLADPAPESGDASPNSVEAAPNRVGRAPNLASNKQVPARTLSAESRAGSMGNRRGRASLATDRRHFVQSATADTGHRVARHFIITMEEPKLFGRAGTRSSTVVAYAVTAASQVFGENMHGSVGTPSSATRWRMRHGASGSMPPSGPQILRMGRAGTARSLGLRRCVDLRVPAARCRRPSGPLIDRKAVGFKVLISRRCWDEKTHSRCRGPSAFVATERTVAARRVAVRSVCVCSCRRLCVRAFETPGVWRALFPKWPRPYPPHQDTTRRVGRGPGEKHVIIAAGGCR